jgi:formylglycine-generating enzyme required for sulfatase activity
VDPNGLNSLGLYNSNMASDANIAGIAFDSGAPAGSKYSVIGSGDRPVTYVSWNDAARFVNWLENGQGSGSTEFGVYDMTQATPARSGSATYWIPSENEWYKAAYYDPGVSGPLDDYWLYPTRSDSVPGNAIGAGPNQANYYAGDYSVTQSASYSGSQNYLTAGGAYTDSASYYGTYDQGGNVWEWNDTVIAGSFRGLRGGSWIYLDDGLRSSFRNNILVPTDEADGIGFRVASVPEPSAALLMMLGGAAWLARRRWKSAL